MPALAAERGSDSRGWLWGVVRGLAVFVAFVFVRSADAQIRKSGVSDTRNPPVDTFFCLFPPTGDEVKTSRIFPTFFAFFGVLG